MMIVLVEHVASECVSDMTDYRAGICRLSHSVYVSDCASFSFNSYLFLSVYCKPNRCPLM